MGENPMFELEHLTPEIRARLPGRSVSLSAGTTYYQLDGPDDGAPVVLLHGMSIPSFIWDPTWESLLAAGLRPLRFDLYGRGYSDRPKGPHNISLYVRQFMELLEALELAHSPLHIVGFSLGAGVGAAFTSKFPHLVRGITLIDPVHPADMPTRPPRLWRYMIRLRMLANSVDEKIVGSLANNFYDYDTFPNFEEQFSAQLAYKGFARAMIATMLDFEFENLPIVYEAVSKLDIPGCLIWGEEDQQADFETSAEMVQLMPGIEFHAIPHAGHLSHYERPDLVNPILLDFLSRT